MRKLKGTVYPPPYEGFPYLAVVVDPDWTVTAVRAFPTEREAVSYLRTTFKAVTIRLKEFKDEDA